MVEKKSVAEARRKAKEYSEKHGGRFHVLDRKGRHAVCLSLHSAIRDLLLAGWSVVCVYEHGEEKPFVLKDFLGHD